MRLLVHHHAIAFQDIGGGIWLPAFIARWINALASRCETIGLLMYESLEKGIHQDEVVMASNVKLYSLGYVGKQSYIPKMRRLRKICLDASVNADGLLIRGITPKQKAIADAVTVKNKAFLLVGSLSERVRPNLTFSLQSFYKNFMFFYRPLEIRKLAHSGVTMLANSPRLVEEIIATINVSATFLPTNSIRRDDFSPLEYREINPQPKILFVGRVVPDKGLAELFQVVKRLGYVTLDIIGSGLSQNMDFFHRLTEELGIKDRVRWQGTIQYGEELFQYYRMADLLVLPTYHEGFPHVIWEAAANSCPVVTTTVGGIPSLWTHNLHGLLVPPRNVELLTEAVELVLENSTLRRELVYNAYYHALNYTVENCSTMTIDILNKLWRK